MTAATGRADGADRAHRAAVDQLRERAVWERHATWWQREFTEGADPEYERQILPLAVEHLEGAERVLDIGCGEGQIARHAKAGGACSVVGVDAAWSQLAEAARRGGAVGYVRSTAGALPFGSSTVDAVVSCLVLEHLSDLDAALDEVARVLVPGGRFLVFLNHPLLQTPGSGWVDDRMLEPPEQYWRVGSYLREQVTVEQVDAGVRLPFFHRPLGRYVNALAERGLVLAQMGEPAPPAELFAGDPEYAGAAEIPRLLFLRAVRGPGAEPRRQ
jgi:SAM-dependent methyltransferase